MSDTETDRAYAADSERQRCRRDMIDAIGALLLVEREGTVRRRQLVELEAALHEDMAQTVWTWD